MEPNFCFAYSVCVTLCCVYDPVHTQYCCGTTTNSTEVNSTLCFAVHVLDVYGLVYSELQLHHYSSCAGLGCQQNAKLRLGCPVHGEVHVCALPSCGKCLRSMITSLISKDVKQCDDRMSLSCSGVAGVCVWLPIPASRETKE